ncbi:hypothetical protein SAMN04487910_1313 [Aquimarina amphilecti]|uniref:50S ribosomal protein L27 n=1 Tax=Aquimarina amphilecti TaxID=1038014 RepID=A0A1H7KIP0_AQUAM|nr:hypothetical protein [Aquimarina amphilecti]SEK85777.1 hypothetical protein SAMN04487910_1313 [Aquimarina amphilecti]
MYEAIQIVHSYWAYLVVLVVTLATINALIGFFTKREYAPKDFRISLFGLIVTHLQLLIGIVIFFVSPTIVWFTEGIGMSEIMKDPLLRLYNVEHPTVMILTVVLITIGYSKHKKKLTSTPKLKMLAIFYTLAWILMLSRIPWANWF